MRVPTSASVRPFLPTSLLLLALVLPVTGCGADQDTDPDASSKPQTQTLAPAEPTVGDTTVDADVPYVATPQETVNAMLQLANVTADDTLYDLGSGDGRVPITAAQKYGAYGVGIEIKPSLVHRARRNAELSGVSDKVEIRQGDIFEANFSDATVVTMYLFPEVNIKLRPMLFEQLAPGTRVVSHSFDMNEWEPDSTVQVNNDVLYLWTIPEEIPAHLSAAPSSAPK